MPFISQIQIEGFRCFESLKVEGFKRINVIVGANNSGKSSLLEAAGIASTAGSPRFLRDCLMGRGQAFPGTEETDGTDAGLADCRELFRGRLQAPTPRQVSFKIGPVSISTDGVQLRGTPGDWVLPLFGPRMGLKSVTTHPLTSTGQPWIEEVSYSLAIAESSFAAQRPIPFNVWSRIAGTDAEETVLGALQLVDPNITRVIWSPPSAAAIGSWEGWYLRRKDSPEREAFSGQGEGLKRVLRIAALVASLSKQGTLLIDEVENGMHYSVIPMLWRFLVDVAAQRDVQVFMTSHSRDFIDGFADAEKAAGKTFDDVAFFRLEKGRKDAVRMSRDAIVNLAHTDNEVR